MSSTSVTIRMDDQLKKDAEALFKDMGMDMTAAISIFVKEAVRQGKIPFGITGDPFYNEANQELLKRVVDQLNNNRGSEHNLIEDNDA